MTIRREDASPGEAAAAPERGRPERPRGRFPLFVVGNSRSGTTMTAKILGRGRAVLMLPELHFFQQIWSSRRGAGPLEPAAALAMLCHLLASCRDGRGERRDPARHAGAAREILERMRGEALDVEALFLAFLYSEADAHGKPIPCDQTPGNVFYLRELLDAYPDARVVSLVRDPRDVLLSQKRKWRLRFSDAWWKPTLAETVRAYVNYHPITTARIWRAAVRTAGRHREDERVFALRYEDLVTEPESRVRDLCEFVGIEFDPRLLEIPIEGSSHESRHGVAHGIDAEKVSIWKRGGLRSAEIWLCEAIVGPELVRHGYHPSGVRPNVLLLVAYVALFPVQVCLSLALNYRRLPALLSSIRRRLA